MNGHPAPLTPANCDLRDFRYMPVEFQRLLSSETWVMSTDTEKVAALTLWGNSWSQVPAGSIPSDDRLLAHMSGAGTKWKKVKAMAMRGWLLCSDGRYYHPVVCEKALEAWLEKITQRHSGGAGNAKRWGADFDPKPLLDEIMGVRAMLESLNPKSRALTKKPPKDLITASHPESGGDRNPNRPPNPESIGLGSQGKGREGSKDQDQEQERGGAAGETGTPAGAVCARLRSEAGVVHTNPNDTRLIAALATGVPPDLIVAVAKEFPRKNLAYVVATATGRHNDAASQAAGATHGKTGAVQPRESVADRVARANNQPTAAEKRAGQGGQPAGRIIDGQCQPGAA